MVRLLVHVEGQTEESFVNLLLRDHLLERGYHSVSARIVGNARQRSRRGGIKPWPAVRRDIVRHLKEDPASLATTMVDFYGLPREGGGAWPGRNQAGLLDTGHKGDSVESGLREDIARSMDRGFDPRRFIPFVVMHEFEGLLFSDCASFSRGIGQANLEAALMRIRAEFATPEDINDSPDTAPSKRVANLLPRYEKPLLGTLAALEIGLDRIRQECPRFHRWLDQLELRVS